MSSERYREVRLGLYGAKAKSIVATVVEALDWTDGVLVERMPDGDVMLTFYGKAEYTAERREMTDAEIKAFIAAHAFKSMWHIAPKYGVAQSMCFIEALNEADTSGFSKEVVDAVIGTQLDPAVAEIRNSYLDEAEKIDEEIDAELYKKPLDHDFNRVCVEISDKGRRMKHALAKQLGVEVDDNGNLL